MHTEHLQNLKPSWVLFGWFVSVAVISLISLVMAAVGLPELNGSLMGAVVIGAGFFLGGLVTGARVGAAPILHGVAMGIVSLLVWFVANLAFGEALGAETWGQDLLVYYAGLLILQMVAAAAGARLGSRPQRRATPAS